MREATATLQSLVQQSLPVTGSDQADYFLKELALGLEGWAVQPCWVWASRLLPWRVGSLCIPGLDSGEYTMPIVGMMSVFDWSEVLEMHHQWTGREWFVARSPVAFLSLLDASGVRVSGCSCRESHEVKKAEVRLAEVPWLQQLFES